MPPFFFLRATWCRHDVAAIASLCHLRYAFALLICFLRRRQRDDAG